MDSTSSYSVIGGQLEELKKENALLKESISEVDAAIAAVTVPAPEELVNITGPEDFWSPACVVEADHAFIEEYGAATPTPDHDGTECFKWDSTMWGAAEHFKVRGGPITHEDGREVTQRLCYRHMAPPATVLTIALAISSFDNSRRCTVASASPPPIPCYPRRLCAYDSP